MQATKRIETLTVPAANQADPRLAAASAALAILYATGKNTWADLEQAICDSEEEVLLALSKVYVPARWMRTILDHPEIVRLVSPARVSRKVKRIEFGREVQRTIPGVKLITVGVCGECDQVTLISRVYDTRKCKLTPGCKGTYTQAVKATWDKVPIDDLLLAEGIPPSDQAARCPAAGSGGFAAPFASAPAPVPHAPPAPPGSVQTWAAPVESPDQAAELPYWAQQEPPEQV